MEKIESYANRNKLSRSLTATVVLLLVVGTLVLGKAKHGRASYNETSQIYIPLVHSNSRLAPVPELVASIKLEGAYCPSDMDFSSYSGLLYVTNRDTKNISVIRGTEFLGNIPTPNWPNFIGTDPESDRVTISNMMGGISFLNGAENTGHIPAYGEAYYVTVNPVNDYTYITDLRGPVTVIRGSERVKDLAMPYFDGQSIGWQLTADYDRITGLTFFASTERGVMTVVDGTEVVDQFDFKGRGASDMIIDSHRGLIVVANSGACNRPRCSGSSYSNRGRHGSQRNLEPAE